ncbi:hypothetical protein [Dermacoccus nishinomiyaensis]|uniref:hypothetical protein n=1 Tax=Dermacoccus nishinomiyaensis TaxID=1274 RepID=UPI0021A899A7|nr:hypothetical protein [Dermacoccus nishinomiyaensis]MCT1605367.1 hypothetical protein [Dermacoccus nishinomiyaensis]
MKDFLLLDSLRDTKAADVAPDLAIEALRRALGTDRTHSAVGAWAAHRTRRRTEYEKPTFGAMSLRELAVCLGTSINVSGQHN